jgi:tRNA(Ile)-lysidine synthase
MNDDESFARVRVRKNLLGELERELGPGAAAALARTADMAREDADFLEALCADIFKGIAKLLPTAVELPVEFLAEQPPAIRNRLIAQAISIFGTPTTRTHVLSIAELVTDWHGQKELALPGIRVSRTDGAIRLKSSKTQTPGAC